MAVTTGNRGSSSSHSGCLFLHHYSTQLCCGLTMLSCSPALLLAYRRRVNCSVLLGRDHIPVVRQSGMDAAISVWYQLFLSEDGWLLISYAKRLDLAPFVYHRYRVLSIGTGLSVWFLFLSSTAHEYDLPTPAHWILHP